MRYFFLTYALLAVLAVGIGGFRGQKFTKPPIQVFPDMDNQDKLLAQAPSTFFADRQGGRLPVTETQPRGFNEKARRKSAESPSMSSAAKPDITTPATSAITTALGCLRNWNSPPKPPRN